MELQSLVVAQRRHLADQLDGLTAEDWETETLCEGWTVRHVVAHLTMPFRHSKPGMLLGILRARGNFNRFADRVARRDAKAPTAELVRFLRDNAEHGWTPPGAGFEAPLTDLVVHSLDIVRPLHLPADIDPAALAVVLQHLVTPRSIEFFGLDLDGLALRACDIEWSYGAGRDVVGSAADLVTALARRKTRLDLAGAGVGQLTVEHAMTAMTATLVNDQLDAMYAALADPTRRRILATLTAGEATVTELAAPFDASLQSISQHVQVLERGA